MRARRRVDVVMSALAAAVVLLVCAGTAVALTPGGATAVTADAAAPGRGPATSGPGGADDRQGASGPGGPDGPVGRWGGRLEWPGGHPAHDAAASPTAEAAPTPATTPAAPATATTGPTSGVGTAPRTDARRRPAARTRDERRGRGARSDRDGRSPDADADGRPVVHLTFDDGPSPQATARVLDLLEQYDARATFFFLGSAVAEHPGLARRVVEAGHGIGNHTWGHRDLRQLRPKALRREVMRTQRVVRDATGRAPSCLRPPYGSTDRRVRARTRALGLRTQMWDVDPRDWELRRPRALVRGVVNEVVDGSVVLLHDGGGDRRVTLEALPAILEELSARGFRFASLCD